MKKKFYISNAQVVDNGIKLYSQQQNGLCSFAFMDEKGAIDAFCLMEIESGAKRKASYWTFISLILVVAWFVFVLTGLPYVQVMSVGCYVFCVYVLLLIAVLFGKRQYALEKNDGAILRCFAAKNMAVNAVNDLQRTPTLDEIKRYSPYLNELDSDTVHLWAASVCLACSFCPVEYVSLCLFGAILVLIGLWRFGCLNFVQKFKIMQPTEKELKLAIAGVKLWFAIENGRVGVKFY